MIWLQTIAQVSVEHIVNALPEGMLVTVFAWALLRLIRRQNSGTRFAVWFLALITIAVLPLLAAIGRWKALTLPGLSSGHLRPAITLPIHWAIVVFVAWAAGVTIAMLRLIAGIWRLHQLRQSCIPIETADLDPVVRNTVRATVDAITARNSANAVTVATSESVRVPAALGFWKRTIVLPAWTLRELPANELNLILLHEFAHLQRGDDWTNLIQKIVGAIFFFNPAVWWIEKQLSMEREMACDDAVLAETANPHGYATCLVSLLEKSLAHRRSEARWSLAQAAVHRACEASLRLAQILDRNRPVATRIWKPAMGLITGFAIVCMMALTFTSQFVAFDHGVVDNSNPVYSSASSRSSLQSSWRGPAVIPAAFRTDEAPSVGGRVTKTHMRPAIIHARTTAVRSQLADFHAEDQSNTHAARVIQTSAVIRANDQNIAPQFRTLVFIEATQYGHANLPVWSIQVWQVTFVSAPRESMARVPVANSI